MTDVRLPTHPDDFAALSPEELRDRYLVTGLFQPGAVSWAFSQQDRLLIGGALPAGGALPRDAPPEIRADRLCDRREAGIACLSGRGTVTADDQTFEVAAEDIVYVGRGARRVEVAGDAVFYLVVVPAHESHPTVLARRGEVETVPLGAPANANVRTLRKYVHEDGVASCELAMGITTIEPGSVWNTMPCHTHDRRTEVYLYFDLAEADRVVHLCGRPDATRSVIVADRQAVISPPWSVHTGAGTAPYRFVWSTAGENLAYGDMDPVDTRELR